ncbi:MAG: hypothetical protein P9L99_13980 [Candidatus Lernaella stagnicola]|nr:hypothetical protein [Candidatus Lernaella stagnicola]
MNPATRKYLGLSVRFLAGGFLLSLLVSMRAYQLPHFHFGLIAVVIGGFLLARRRNNRVLLLDAVIAYLALFLIPPGFIGWSLSFAWTFSSLTLALLVGLATWRLSDSRFTPFVAAVTVAAIASAGATVNTFRLQLADMPVEWAGVPTMINDAGIDRGAPTSRMLKVAPRRKLGELPQPVPHGDPPAGRVVGLVERGDAEFYVRGFAHASSAEITPSRFVVPECNPVRDIDFDRAWRQWLVLCGAGKQLVYYQGDARITKLLDLPGIWPFRLTVHQELERVFIVDPGGGYLIEVALESNEILRQPHVGFGISDVEITPDGRFLYIPQPYRSRIIVLSVTDLETVREVPLSFGVAHLAVDRTRGRIYAVAMGSGKLFSLDPQTHEIVGEGDLNSPVLDAEYDDAAARLYWTTPRGYRWSSIDSLLTK